MRTKFSSGCYYNYISEEAQHDLEQLDDIGDSACILLHADVLTSVARILLQEHQDFARTADSLLLVEVTARSIAKNWGRLQIVVAFL